MINTKPLYTAITFLTFILSFSFCSENENNKIIEKDIFVKIMADMHIAESIMTDKGWYDGMLKDSTSSYYNYILKKYNVSRNQFDNSLQYYSKDLEDLEFIFAEEIAYLNKKIPKKLNPNSIYIILEKVIEEAKMRNDPTLRFGQNGIELWKQKNIFNFPNDTSRYTLHLNQEIKHQSLIVFKADYMILPKNKTKKMKMRLILQYADTTADTTEKTIKIQKSKWDNCYLVLKTDSTKKPTNINSSVFVVDSITPNTFVNIKSVSLKQYARNKDTTNMFVKPKSEPIVNPAIKRNKLKQKTGVNTSNIK
jgi:hypothetical protein